MTTVMVFGSFDHVHPGHEWFFNEARRFGDHLIVVVALDETIRHVKGRPPEYTQDERIEHIKRYADEVLPGESDKYQLVRTKRPDVICLGHDQEAFVVGLRTLLAEEGLPTRIERLDAYKRDQYRSSLFRK